MGEESVTDEDDFLARRMAARRRLGADNDAMRERRADPGRSDFFASVYELAGGDAANVPWADLQPKPQLAAYLADHPGNGRNAIDIACGLGDNAVAIAEAGWKTTAFDYAGEAVRWARQRFADKPVDWRVADLTRLPQEWRGAFDLVHECYTVQSVPPERHEAFSAAIASLVAPGGTLLIYARTRDEGQEADGPPWPLTPTELDLYAAFGLKRIASDNFQVVRPDKSSANRFDIWRRPG